MTTLQLLCQWLYDLPTSTALRESDEVFPLIETLHVLAITLIAGTIVTVDLRAVRSDVSRRVADPHYFEPCCLLPGMDSPSW